MIGSVYRKFAQEMGMKVGQGIAYGSLRGYSATLCEGSGWKQMTVNTRIPGGGEALLGQLELDHNRKTFSIREVRRGDGAVAIVFIDTIGTMKKIRAFADWFFPMLDEAGAEKYEVCDLCGAALGAEGVWKKVDDAAYHVHPACGTRLEGEIRQSEQLRQESDSGSYLTGLIGALLGALLGAVAWAAVYEFGYVASIVGLLIAYLAVKGYDLLRGKQGKGMTALIFLAVIFGVVAGNALAYSWELWLLIQSGDIPIAVSQIPAFLAAMLQDPEFRAAVLKDLSMGLFFALLGAYGILSRAAKSVGNAKITELK